MLGLIATAYGFWLCYAAGDSMLLSSLLFTPGILVFLWQKKSQGQPLLKSYELAIAIAILALAAWTLKLVISGNLQIA